MKDRNKNITQKKKSFFHKNGRIYFSKDTERKVFFVLTIIMLILGIFAKF